MSINLNWYFFAAGARKRRAQANFFYVEILKINQLSTQRQSLLILTALDATNKYFPLLASEACALLANTERKCVESCELLIEADLPCGQGGSNRNVDVPRDEASQGLSTGGVAGIALVVIALLIAILAGAVFYYRRKYKMAKVTGFNWIFHSALKRFPSFVVDLVWRVSVTFSSENMSFTLICILQGIVKPTPQ